MDIKLRRPDYASPKLTSFSVSSSQHELRGKFTDPITDRINL